MNIRGIELYPPDIYAIPYYNYQKFNRYLIMQSGIGSDTPSIMSRFNAIAVHAGEGRLEDVQTESSNLVLAVFSALEGISYDSMAFACMVKAIDGQAVEIGSDEKVKALSDRIIATGITADEIAGYISTLKKKLIPN